MAAALHKLKNKSAATGNSSGGGSAAVTDAEVSTVVITTTTYPALAVRVCRSFYRALIQVSSAWSTLSSNSLSAAKLAVETANLIQYVVMRQKVCCVRFGVSTHSHVFV